MAFRYLFEVRAGNNKVLSTFSLNVTVKIFHLIFLIKNLSQILFDLLCQYVVTKLKFANTFESQIYRRTDLIELNIFEKCILT